MYLLLFVFLGKPIFMKTYILKSIYVAIAVLLYIPLNLSAQEREMDNPKDSIHYHNSGLKIDFDYLFPRKEFESYESPTPPFINMEERFVIEKLNLSQPYYPLFLTDKSPLHKGEYRIGGVIKGFKNSAILGSGSQENLIGLGVVNTANLTYHHRINDRLSYTVYVDAVKYNIPRNASQQFGVGGTLSYQVTDIVGFHLFGNYKYGKNYYAMGNIYGGSSFGGYFTIEMGDRFGMGLGAQHYYNPNMGRWETDPIVMPYFKLNNGAKIGFDVGGIIKGSIKNAIDNKRINVNSNPRSRYNATIMPERPPIIIR